jgi:LuxR family maltose regulon positive regulatory protein
MDVTCNKLLPPALPLHTVPVAAYGRALEGLLQQRVHVITAPAGYGKSVLLAQLWQAAQERGAHALWLDEPSTLPLLARDLSTLSATSAPVALFLDNCERLSDSAASHALDEMIQTSPANVFFFFASRTALPLRLSRLQLAQQVGETGTPELAMAPAAARALLLEVGGRMLGEDQVLALHEVTEGWPAGLKLAALALRQGADPDVLARELCHGDRDLAAYLGDVALGRLPAELEAFLHCTALPERFSLDWCRDVLYLADPAAMIAAIERRGLPLIRLDRNGNWYRYLRPFGATLRQRMEAMAPEDTKRLYRDASNWFAASGEYRDAIEERR